MKLRAFEDSDAKQLCDLHVNVIRTVNAADYSQEQVEAWAGGRTPEKVISSLKHVDDRFVVEEDGQVLGFADRDAEEIRGLYVDPRAQGRGVGSLLLERVLDCMREDGFLAARVESTLTAESFYAKHGFVRVRAQTKEIRGVELPTVLMQLVL